MRVADLGSGTYSGVKVADSADDLLDQLVLGQVAHRGRRSSGGQGLFYVRDLTPEDVLAVANGEIVPAAVPALQVLRAAHHQVARLIAEGKSHVTISAMTGRTTASIHQLLGDPTFQELVEYYATQREEEFLGVQRQLAALGMTAAEILQERLEDAETVKGMSVGTLLAIMESTLDRSVAPNKGRTPAVGGRNAPAAGTPAVTLNVKFAGGPGDAPPPHTGPTIELTVNEDGD